MPESSGTESVPQVAPTRERAGAKDVFTSTGKQTGVDDDLIQAAWNDDTIRAEALIAAGGDVNYQDHTRQSAYLIATSEGHLDLLELTFEHGADTASLDSYDGTGLIRAAERGHADVVGRLLQTDIAVNHINNLGWTALHEAIILGDGSQRYVDTVRLLVAGGADVELAPHLDSNNPPLQLALTRGQDDIARTIQAALEAEPLADPDTALLDAAASGDADRAALALARSADIETRDANQRTPLLLAAVNNHPGVARLLVALGANPDALDDRHDTPWLVTGVSGSVAMADILLRADPDLTILNRYGGTALIPASERGHVDYVRRVVETDIDINHINDLGWTALMETVLLGDGTKTHQDIVEILLGAGADPAITDRDGVTPVQHAEARGFDEIVRLLGGG
ncbi:MAG: ankyrin repeat domain-containing protein [Ilumatobacteraceae bacterium]